MKKQARITFLFGLPCSGKSHFYKEQQEIYSGFTYVSADEIKKEFPDYNEESVSMYSNEAIALAERRVQEAIDRNEDVIMDAGGINNNYTLRILAYAKKADYETTMINIDTPYHICMDRNSKRARKVPESLISSKAFKKDYHWEKYKRSELVDIAMTIPYYTEQHMFFDMDGVLAAQSNLPVINGKIDFVNSRHFRYLPVVEQVRDIVKYLHESGKDIYILSAAPTSISAKEKELWLEDNFPFIKKENIFFVNSGRYKAEMFNDLATRLKLDRKDMCLVEDTHETIKTARREYRMHSIHVSEFLSKYRR